MLVPDSAAALAETRRVLRPGGRLAFAVWTPAPRTRGAPRSAAPCSSSASPNRPSPTRPAPSGSPTRSGCVRSSSAARFATATLETVEIAMRYDVIERLLGGHEDLSSMLLRDALERSSRTPRRTARARGRRALDAVRGSDGLAMPGRAWVAAADTAPDQTAAQPVPLDEVGDRVEIHRQVVAPPHRGELGEARLLGRSAAARARSRRSTPRSPPARSARARAPARRRRSRRRAGSPRGLATSSPGPATRSSSPIRTPTRPSSTNEYSSSCSCVCSGAASARGAIGCSTSAKRPPVSSPPTGTVRRSLPKLTLLPSFGPITVMVIRASLLSIDAPYTEL